MIGQTSRTEASASRIGVAGRADVLAGPQRGVDSVTTGSGEQLTLRVAKIHSPITALGPGRRVGLWLQGCTVGCAGCLSLDTWDTEAVAPIAVEEVVAQVLRFLVTDPAMCGLTISGGEPLEQSSALVSFLHAVRESTVDRPVPIDVLLYSGRIWRRIERENSDLLTLVDVVIPEPFVAAKAPGEVWRGSSNQPLKLLSELARRRYQTNGTDNACRPLQVSVVDGRLWTVGVPGPGDLDRMLDLAKSRGVEVGEVSWRS